MKRWGARERAKAGDVKVLQHRRRQQRGRRGRRDPGSQLATTRFTLVVVACLSLAQPVVGMCPANCPPGLFSFVISTFPIPICDCRPCDPGSFSPGGQVTACTPWTDCAPGLFESFPPSPSQDRGCAGCPANTFKPFFGNDPSCGPMQTCGPGTFMVFPGTTVANRDCAACPTMTYTTGNNQLFCAPHDPCNSGERVVTTGVPSENTVCTPCGSNAFAPGPNFDTSCTPHIDCTPGQAEVTDGTPTTDRVCEVCQPGTFSNTVNQNSCQACGPNSFAGTPGLTSCSQWDDCQPGFYVDGAPSAVNNRICTVCEPSHYSDFLNQETCTPWSDCGPGFSVSVDPDAQRDRECEACVLGSTFTQNVNEPQCNQVADCFEGFSVSVQPTVERDRECQSCSPGSTFTDTVNEPTCRPHTTCNPGELETGQPSTFSDRTCEPCPPDSFSEVQNSPSCTTQPDCVAGQHEVVPPALDTPRECAACTAGEFSTTTNAVSCTAWTTCDPGEFTSTLGTVANDQACSACPPSSFTNIANQIQCLSHAVCNPGERVTQLPSSVQDRGCAPCNTEEFSAGTNEASCTPWTTCAAGERVTQTPLASRDRLCEACAPETFTSSVNQQACTAQVNCVPGERVETAATLQAPRLCVACPLGQFSSTTNQGSCVAWTQCNAGAFVSTPGTPSSDQACSACPPNTFSATGDSTCTPQIDCDPGEFVSQVGTPSVEHLCSACGAEEFSTATNQATCVAWAECPTGQAETVAPTPTSDRLCTVQHCNASLSFSKNAITTAASCSNTVFNSTCQMGCPAGFLGETTTFSCDGVGGSGSGLVDWIGRPPVCYRASPRTVTTANSLYTSGTVEHNTDGMVATLDAQLGTLGIGLNAATGLMTGVFAAAAVGTTTFTNTLRFSGSPATFVLAFNITVNSPLQESETTLTVAQNVFFDGVTPGILGGTPPFVFSLEEGSLPNGLSVNTQTGQVTGVPTAQGAFRAKVSVKDDTGAKLVLQQFRLLVTSGLSIQWNRTEPIPVAVEGEQFALPPPNFTSNAQGPLSFTAGGQLPAGVALDPLTGTLFGVPAVGSEGTFPLVILASDATNVLVEVERFDLVVRRPLDCDSPSNGPNGLGCNTGECLDVVAFDESFACNCSGVPFEGDNCETPTLVVNAARGTNTVSTPIIGTGSALAAVALILGVLFLLARRRAHALANKPFDFEDELDKMKEQGLLRTSNVPREIQRRKIKMLDKLGAGQFGDVFKGTVDESDTTGVPEYLAAIKTLKDDPSGFEKTELMREAATMAQFNHPNVVNLIGVCTSGMPYLMVVQFCEHGALNSFLKKVKAKSDGLDFHALMRIAHDVAKGMEYLNGRGLVHRDLAARNVLLDSSHVCKVADFGLSRDLDAGDYYRSGERGMVPVRWTAPEALDDRKFSSQSDMWAYGITMHEVFTYAELPYKKMTNQVCWLQVKNGYRLPREPNCPEEFYEGVMLPSWAAEASDRPSFTAVIKFLEASYKMLVPPEEDAEGAEDWKQPTKAKRLETIAPGKQPAPMPMIGGVAAGVAPGIAKSLSGGAGGNSNLSTPSIEVALLPEDATGYVDFSESRSQSVQSSAVNIELVKAPNKDAAGSEAEQANPGNPYVLDTNKPTTRFGKHLYEEPGRGSVASVGYISVNGVEPPAYEWALEPTEEKPPASSTASAAEVYEWAMDGVDPLDGTAPNEPDPGVYKWAMDDTPNPPVDAGALYLEPTAVPPDAPKAPEEESTYDMATGGSATGAEQGLYDLAASHQEKQQVALTGLSSETLDLYDNMGSSGEAPEPDPSG